MQKKKKKERKKKKENGVKEAFSEWGVQTVDGNTGSQIIKLKSMSADRSVR